MTPDRFEQAHGPAQLLQILLGEWLTPADEVTGIKSIDSDAVAEVRRVGYRLYVVNHGRSLRGRARRLLPGSAGGDSRGCRSCPRDAALGRSEGAHAAAGPPARVVVEPAASLWLCDCVLSGFSSEARGTSSASEHRVLLHRTPRPHPVPSRFPPPRHPPVDLGTLAAARDPGASPGHGRRRRRRRRGGRCHGGRCGPGGRCRRRGA